MFSDHYAVAKFKKLVKEYGIKTVVETGTWKGDSIIKIAELVPTSISIEINREYYGNVRERLGRLGYGILDETENWVSLGKKNHVVLYCGNSPDVIKAIIEFLEEPILFLLDAHWLEYWPLKDEIRAIKPCPNSIILIHDVKVLGKDFGYDVFGGITNEYGLYKDDLAFVNPDYKISYNEKASGTYRGILYAVPNKGEKKWKNLMSS